MSKHQHQPSQCGKDTQQAIAMAHQAYASNIIE